MFVGGAVVLFALGVAALPVLSADAPWKRHAIDNSSRGADGVRLADANGDGLLDITTGWEEGGVIRVYLNPGPAKAKEKWPRVTVGEVKSPEDAVFVDLDGDGAMDVISSCEGNTKMMYVHWAPKEKAKYLDAKAWTTEPIPATQGQMWMYCLPMQVDGKGGIDLIVSSKGGNACVGWLEAPENPRDLKAWKLHRIRDAGWIMSLIATDMDGDGEDDILFSDRKGKASGVYWLKLKDRAKATQASAWKEHTIGAVGKEVMFIARDGFLSKDKLEVVAVTKPNVAHCFQAAGGADGHWQETKIECETKRFGNVKAVRAADLTGSGQAQLIMTCEGAEREKSGVYLVIPPRPFADEPYRFIDIAGPEGVKYDRIELIDLDGDGDLDILTCEERDNLGVIWYENPGK
ncbi:MAG: VCBS repeat-containing protein [Phycisphaeraceae bacterium]